MTDSATPSEPVATVPCDHCERVFRADQSHPVVVTGGQSYAGHILTGRSSSRHVWLCRACYANLRNTSIEGFRVEDETDPPRVPTAKG